MPSRGRNSFDRRPLLLTGVLALLAGCSPGDRDEATVVPAPEAGAQAGESPPAGTAAPSSPWLAAGACPFECCTYGEWTAVTTISVHPAELDSSAVAFTLAPGEPFTASTGNVYVISPGVAVATDTITLGSPPLRLSVGDTVQLLDHLGEGVYNLRHDGLVFVGEGFWAMMPLSGRPAAGTLLAEPVTEWWVRIATPDGREGWIEMNREGQGVRGNDACA
jgi:hypothetical protein